MSVRGHSYIGEGRGLQIALVRGLGLAFLTLSLGGCAGLGLPFGEGGGQLADNGPAGRPILASAVVVDQADPSDWETIRRTVEGAPKAAGRVEWSNAITGSVGSISLAADVGEKCRNVAMTINDVRGIRRYRGEACVGASGRSQVHNVVADDATLL